MKDWEQLPELSQAFIYTCEKIRNNAIHNKKYEYIFGDKNKLEFLHYPLLKSIQKDYYAITFTNFNNNYCTVIVSKSYFRAIFNEYCVI